MSIKSRAFGRVTLTERDAEKFRAQATYGRPKPAAVANVQRGVKLTRALKESGGKVRVTLTNPSKRG
jgi:hypothetical protein